MIRSPRVLLFLACLCSVLSLAQDTRGKVQGVVTDSSGAIVAGANITLLNDETGVRALQHSNPNGQYRFDFVIPGMYTVAVELPGFRPFVQKNVRVEALGDVTVNASLAVGSAQE